MTATTKVFQHEQPNKPSLTRSVTSAPPIAILGVPFDNVTISETVHLIDVMVASGNQHYMATANVDFLVQAQDDVELRRILMDAHLVLCDGTPLLWASRLLGNPLPERVAGSDLVPLLIGIAAKKKYRIFFLGGTPESTAQAVKNMEAAHPDLIIAGHYSPPFSSLLDMDHEEIRRRILESQPDLLFVAFGCPKQEKWISMHYRSLGVPVSVGVGATIDFLAGTARRAPRWMQKSGTEWVFRLIQEPRRLFKRYAKDLFHFSRAIACQWWEMRHTQKQTEAAPVTAASTPQAWQRVRLPRRVDIETVRRDTMLCEEALSNSRCCLLELNNVEFIDSTGMGLLIRLQKKARITARQLILVAPSNAVMSALKLMRLQDFFTIVRNIQEGLNLLENAPGKAVFIQPNYFPSKPALCWRGEITAANVEEVWETTEGHIIGAGSQSKITIDLSSLRFIDSAGVGLMIRASKKAKVNGAKLEFIGMQPNVRNVLRIAKLETILLGAA
ncbi:MAG: WecB/TagA/CpsF family glycosyltransferase [Verrucomicrobia bacterium]|nr:WecB/TagA/CpsF family glycosyltransferase [Verrucomicrobiota bacterium]